MSSGDYRQASLEVWQRMAEGWDRERRWMWDCSHGISEWMIDALAPQPGETILELASGSGETGFAAAALVGDDGRVISTDFAPKMVEAARSESERLGLHNVEHRQLDAERMDLDDDSVDGVLCRWGYMLMADPEQALRETRRVLREGGRLVLAVVGTPERNPWASVPARAFLEQTGVAPPDPTAPGIFALADAGRTRSLLAAAGFEVRRMEDVEMTWRFDDFDAYWAFLTEIAGGIALAIAGLSDEDRQALRARIEDAVETYRLGSGYALPAVTQNTFAV